MSTASVRSNLRLSALILYLCGLLTFQLVDIPMALADDGAALNHCVFSQQIASQQARSGHPRPWAATEQTYLPFISTPPNADPPVAGAVRLAESPRIDRFLESGAHGKRCVTFEVTNNTGHEIPRLAIEHTLYINAGTVTDFAADSTERGLFESSYDQDGAMARCRFENRAGSGLGAGQQLRMSCQYAESETSVLSSSTRISPTPFFGYDDNYDQIGDSLSQVVATQHDERPTIPVLVLLDRRPQESDMAVFREAGGQVTYLPVHLPLFGGDLPLGAVSDVAVRLAAHLEVIGYDGMIDLAPFTRGLVGTGANVATIPELEPIADGDDSRQIAIGILDTGLDETHEGLQGRIAGWYDVLAPDKNTPIDPAGHGSYVAGIAAGETNEFQGVVSASPLIGIRHGEEGSWRIRNFVQAIDWAIANRQRLDITVLNNSNVYTRADLRHNPFWDAAAREAVENGMLFVNAAGDGYGESVGGEVIGSPATEPKVLTVGSVTPANDLSYFSSHGLADAAESALKKPDILAPGSNVRSIMAGQSGDDELVVQSGTSAAAPYVAGEAALLAAHLYDAADADDDADNRSGEDGWDGIDNDGDDLIDEDSRPWDFNESSVMTVKSLILMAAAEVGGGEVVPQDRPNAGAVNDPRSREDRLDDGWDRGEKDHIEGFGSVDIRAALDAVAAPFCGVGRGIFGSLPTERRVWARHLHLYADKTYSVVLDGPENADYDLYLYRAAVGPYGEPEIARQPGFDGRPIAATNVATADESLTFQIRSDGLYYLVVRRVDGEGPFQLHLSTPSAWTVLFYMAAEQANEKHLDAQAFDLLNELERVGSAQGSMRDVQIVALVDYDARNWQDDGLIQAMSGIAGDALLYCVRKDHRPRVSQFSVPVQDVDFFTTTVDINGVLHSEANMGDPDTLSAFAAFAVDHFPASNYALFLWGDDQGFGWKSDPDGAIGLGSDTRLAPNGALDSSADALTMDELGEALAQIGEKIGQGSDFMPVAVGPDRLALLGLDMGQMAQVTVAAQVQPWVDVLVAPQTNLVNDLPYAEMLEALKCRSAGSGWDCSPTSRVTGADLGERLVEAFAASGEQSATPQVLSVLRLNGGEGGTAPCDTFSTLMDCIDTLAIGLTEGIENPVPGLDNTQSFQVLFKEQVRDRVAELNDRNNIDLAHFAQLLGLSTLEGQYRRLAGVIADQLYSNDSIVLASTSHGLADNLHGLSIYFPAGQLTPDDGCTERPDGSFACGYANPLPSPYLYAADSDTRLPTTGQAMHPRPALSNLRYVLEHSWDAFLHRYYRPVAAACLLEDGHCRQYLSVQVGDEVSLSGSASSDLDGQTSDYSVDAWYWDFDLASDSSVGLPVYAEDPDLPCSEDCDRDGQDEGDDDAESSGVVTTWRCQESGLYTMRLIVHDDHHRQPALHGESSHSRHWNVDEDTVFVSCSVSPFQAITPNPIVSTRPFSYTLVVRGNRELTSPATGSMSVTMPSSVTVDPATIFCSDGICQLDPVLPILSWSGEMVAGGEVRITFDAMVDGSDLVDGSSLPMLVIRADIFDGFDSASLELTTPVIVKQVEPATAAPGSTLTYTTIVPANEGLAEPDNAELFDFFDNVALWPYLALTGDMTYPEGSLPPVDELYSGQISWRGEIDPAEAFVVRYQVRISEDLPADFCGNQLSTNGQVLDGIVPSNNVNTSVPIVCPGR